MTRSSFTRTFLAAVVMQSVFWGGSVHAQPMVDTVRMALPTHPRVLSALSSFQASEADIEVSETNWNTRVLADGGLGTQRNFVSKGSNYRTTVATPTVRVRKLVFDAGRTDSEVATKKARADESLWTLRATEEDVALQICEAYLQVVQAKNDLFAARSWIDGLNNIASMTREIAAYDRGRQFDAVHAESRVNSAIAVFNARQANLAEAARQLNAIVGKSTWVELPTKFFALAAPTGHPAEDTRAYTEHPRVQIANAEVEASKAQVALSNMYNKPRFEVELFASSGQDVFGKTQFLNTAGVQLIGSHTFLDGGTGKATVQVSRMRQVQAEKTLDATLRDVRTATGRYMGADEGRRERLEGFRIAAESAQKLRAMMVEQFRAGRRPILDLLGQENEIYQTALTYNNELQDTVRNMIRLAHARGELLAFLEIAPQAVPTAQDSSYTPPPNANPNVSVNATPAATTTNMTTTPQPAVTPAPEKSVQPVPAPLPAESKSELAPEPVLPTADNVAPVSDAVFTPADSTQGSK